MATRKRKAQPRRVVDTTRGDTQRLHRLLREQADWIIPDTQRRIAECPELQALVRCAKAKGRGRFQFRGGWFSVRSNETATSAIYGPSGRLVSFYDVL